MTMFRQGDILLVRTDQPVPPGASHVESSAGRIIVAHGEATGHAHVVTGGEATLYESHLERFLDVRRPSTLVHEEHGAIDLGVGVYRVVRQREYSPGEIRSVQD